LTLFGELDWENCERYGEEELDKLITGKPWDYVIGAVHFINGWGFDNLESAYIFEKVKLMNLYKTHTSYVCQAIESQLFDIAAHLDNLKVFGYRPNEKLLQGCYEKVALSLRKHNIATELNTGLAYRAPIEEACPSPYYLQMLANIKSR
jgi:histidinol-phosphatase (PHP family)